MPEDRTFVLYVQDYKPRTVAAGYHQRLSVARAALRSPAERDFVRIQTP